MGRRSGEEERVGRGSQVEGGGGRGSEEEGGGGGSEEGVSNAVCTTGEERSGVNGGGGGGGNKANFVQSLHVYYNCVLIATRPHIRTLFPPASFRCV